MLNKNKFKNIIFDLGGVIINIDYSLTINAFNKFGINDFSNYFSQSSQKQIFDLFEKGKISAQEFRDEIIKHSKNKISNHEFDMAWNAMLLDLPISRLALLAKIKSTHRTFLLSNTNEIHINYLSNYFQKTFNKEDLNTYFEKIYYSFKVGMRKPDAEIFQMVLSENNLNPNETLFIDDTLRHVEGANKVGITGYFLDLNIESIETNFQVLEI